jgi:hypothetical protein
MRQVRSNSRILTPARISCEMNWADMVLGQRVVTLSTSETVRTEISAGQACRAAGPGQARLSDADVAEIVRLALLINGVSPSGSGEIRSSLPWSVPLVVGEDISRAWLVRLRELPVILMSPHELQRLANRNGQISYISLSDIRPTTNCAAVTVESGLKWMRSRRGALVI